MDLLTRGEMEIEGRLPNSSNYTFLARLSLDGDECRAVYKPEQGERELTDFPPQLFKREVAAYELSVALGWPNIPPTALRDGTFGEGSVQLFVNADFERHYFTLLDDETLHDQLIDIAAFDVVANNTDRKAGHCLWADHTVYAIDNGLCFHTDDKLRTVIWDFAGSALPSDRVADLARVASELPPAVLELLEDDEADALRRRVATLADNPVLPAPTSEYQYPWPLF